MAGPRLSLWTSIQISPMRSGVSSPWRRSSWMRRSNSTKAIWRTTVFSMSSTLEASMILRRFGSFSAPSMARKVSISPKTDAVSASVSGVSAISAPLGERHHVARLALVVQEQIRMRARHGRMGEGARRLVGPYRRVDPAIVEKTPADRGKFGGEGGIGIEHGALGLGPGDDPVLLLGKRRIAVPIGQGLAAEPPGF